MIMANQMTQAQFINDFLFFLLVEDSLKAYTSPATISVQNWKQLENPNIIFLCFQFSRKKDEKLLKS